MGRTPCCSKVGLNRGPWTPEEDDLLTKYIDVYGEGGWRTLPKKAGLLRCGKSCRLRWMNYLRPDVKRGQILPEEEDLILRLHRLLGNRWSLIAGRIPGRTDNEIKNYWNTHLSRKLISQGIDPRTHKPLSESEVPAVSDSPGNNSKSAQKALQQQTSVSQHFDPPPHNLTPAIVSDYQEVTSEEIPKPADNNDNEGLQNVQNHNPSSRAAPTSETCVILHSPHLVPSVFNNFCAGEMSSNALSTPATANHMRSCHAFNPLGALAHSDTGIKHAQASFAINNLAPLFSCPDHHASGVLDVVGAAPYLRTNSVTNNYYMAPSTSTASGWHRTSFFGHCVDPAPSDLPSPLISGINSSGGAGDKFPTTGTLEESVSMQHIIPSVNEVESATYSNIVHSSARTPVSAADHEDSNLDTFSSFLESFINEELLNENNELVAPTSASRTMQQCSDHGSTGVPYDSWSLMSPSSQYLAK